MSKQTIISALFLALLIPILAKPHEPIPAVQQPFLDSASFTTFALFQQAETEAEPSLQQSSEKMSKSRGKAFFMSLLIPGWGQRYAGANLKSSVFFGVEVGLWLTYAGFRTYSNWREEDYRNYAATNAGVTLDGKTNTFFIDVGNFDSVYEHNEYRLRQRNTVDYYYDTEAYYWQWQNQAHRDKFDQLRISSDTAENRATFVLGTIVANHIISAIEAVWSVHQYEKNRVSTLDWNLRFGDGLRQPTVHFSLTKHF